MEFPTITWSKPQHDDKLYGLKIKSKSDLENLDGYYALDFSFAETVPGIASCFNTDADYNKISKIKYVKNPGSYFYSSKLQIDWAEFEKTEFHLSICAKNIKVNNCYTNIRYDIDCESLEIHNCIPSDTELAKDTVKENPYGKVRANHSKDSRFTIWCVNQKYQINYFKSDWFRLGITGDPKMKYYEGLPLLEGNGNGLSEAERYKNIESVKLHASRFYHELAKNMELVENNCPFDYSHQNPLVLMSVVQNMIDQSLKAAESKIANLESKNVNLEYKISQLTARIRDYEPEKVIHKIDLDELQIVISKLKKVNIPDRQLLMVDIREFLLNSTSF